MSHAVNCTGHLGSWAPDYTPCARGFDSFLGYLGGAEDYFYHNVTQYGCSGLDFVQATSEQFTAADMYGGIYSAGLFGDRGAQIITQTEPGTPLLMYLPFQSVHSPVQAPAALIEQYQGRPRPKFMAMVKALDDAIGTLRTALRTSGREDNAVWIVTTDNGGCYWSYGNNHPLRGNKISYWNGGTQGLAFVSSPLLRSISSQTDNQDETSVRNATFIMHAADWYATVLEIAGLPASSLPKSAIDSIGQWEAIQAAASTGGRTELVHHAYGNGMGKIRRGRWQLYNVNTSLSGLASLCNPSVDGWRGNPTIDDPFGTTEPPARPADCSLKPCLFDLSVDQAERHDVAVAHPDIVRELLTSLKAAVCPETICHVDVAPGDGHCSTTACDVLNTTGCFGPHCTLPPGLP